MKDIIYSVLRCAYGFSYEMVRARVARLVPSYPAPKQVGTPLAEKIFNASVIFVTSLSHEMRPIM